MWHTKNAIDILICVCVKSVYYSECKLFLKLKWHMISNLTSMKLLFKIHHTTRTHTHTHTHRHTHTCQNDEKTNSSEKEANN